MAHSIRTEKREDFEERKKVASGLIIIIIIIKLFVAYSFLRPSGMVVVV
jgi:hypothetical protein